MEYMYSIPDLEVFIDKTIKKCLLEYDLDANDTEAVLDDMEKTWPKSLLEPSEKQVLKDCNDNTDKRRRIMNVARGNRIQDEEIRVIPFEKDVSKYGERSLCQNARQSAGRLWPNGEDPTENVSNGRNVSEPMGGDCNRSDTSSPDVFNGTLQMLKHPKLKSRLQQRYFEGNKKSNNDINERRDIDDERVFCNREVNDCLPSNLDILASAANIHTEARTGSHMIRDIPLLQDEPDRLLLDMASGCNHTYKSSVLDSAREMSDLPRKLTVSTTSVPQHPDQYNDHSEGDVSRPHTNSERIHETNTNMADNFHKHGQLFSHEIWEDNSSSSLVNIDKAKHLYQHYQNGYHALMQKGHVVLGSLQASSSCDRDLGTSDQQTSTQETKLPLSLKTETDKSDSSTNYHHSTTHPRLHQHQQPNVNPSSYSLPHHHLHHWSRIASIIAEELHKDNPSHPNTSPIATIPSADVLTPASVDYPAARAATQAGADSCNKVVPRQPVHCPSQTSSHISSHPSQTSSHISSRPSQTSSQTSSHISSHQSQTSSQTSSHISSHPFQTSSHISSHPSQTSSQISSHISSHPYHSSHISSHISSHQSLTSSPPSQTSSHILSYSSQTSSQISSHQPQTASHISPQPSQTSSHIVFHPSHISCHPSQTSCHPSQTSRHPSQTSNHILSHPSQTSSHISSQTSSQFVSHPSHILSHPSQISPHLFQTSSQISNTQTHITRQPYPVGYTNMTKAHSPTATQSIPAHFMNTIHNLRTVTLAAHAGQEPLVVSDNPLIVNDEDQPQDLSKTAVRNSEYSPVDNHLSYLTVNITCSKRDSKIRGHNSSQSSPLPATGSHIVSSSIRKSASPSNSTGRHFENSSGCGVRITPLKRSRKFEKEGQVQIYDSWSSGDSKVIGEKKKKTKVNLRRLSNTGDLDKNKNRKIEIESMIQTEVIAVAER